MIATIKNSTMSDERLEESLSDAIVFLLMQAHEDGKKRKPFTMPDIERIIRDRIQYSEMCAAKRAADK